MPQIKKIKTASPPASGVYLFTGDDEFRKELSLDRLKAKLFSGGINAFNYENFSGRYNTAEEIICSLETLPLSGSNKLIVLREPEFLSKEDKNRLAVYLTRPRSEKTILALLCKKLTSKDDMLGSFILKQAKVIDFSNLEPDELRAWIIKEFKARGKIIGNTPARLICDASSHDLAQALSIIEQVTLFSGEQRKITEEDATFFTEHAMPEVSVFKFLDYINDRDTNRSLSILKSMLSSGNSPQKIIGLLNWHITRLIAAKRLIVKRVPRSGMSPYFKIGSYALNRLISQSENFTLKQLKSQLNILLDTDLMLKRSGLKPEFLLEMLVIKWGRS
ncbi:MAG: DNA polymerase III subunit delta [Candidatus Omnitrophota bacterium]